MARLRRYYAPGQVYFITSVTYIREEILVENFELLEQAIKEVVTRTPFKLKAWVVLPDHMHLMVDPLSNDLSKIMKQIKLVFSHRYRELYHLRSVKLWQPRFWDHIIRDRDDWNIHIDYIHFNPVKHGYVNCPFDWQFSSIHKLKDEYPANWGVSGPIELEGEFGE